ncbi:denticleless protein homolog [Polypterus senegalus]|uniref:denticleless protein homolog n=1 Tax=Polypterus senegalus TaxID=55291 RepID=UPI0019658847|nr:denticleless protein homolog [Polypterus senegalus]
MLFQAIVGRGISSRKCNGTEPRLPLHSLLGGYQCARADEHISYGELGAVVPPFGCTFSSAQGIQHVLAVANEEGIIRLYDTEACRTPVLKEWLAHSNAVFDIAWVPGEHKLVTASGDQTAKLWDVKTSELLGIFKGHQCSLKSVAFAKQEKAVFCTGGRDGNIMVWDMRCSKKDGFYKHVKQISGAHNKPSKETPLKQKKKKQPTSQQSVTAVLMRDEHSLLSAGAVDGVLKLWDLRKNYTAHLQDPVPLQSYPYPGSSLRKLGFSSLVLDSSGSSLFANCTDENIYMFNMAGLKTEPVAVFSGHLNSTFYVKSSVSPDDQFLASGSSDHNAYIWKISEPQSPPILLQGHCQEVTSVTWCPTDFTKIATCSDDNTVRVWRLNRGAKEEKTTLRATDLVGWASKKQTSKGSEPMTPSDQTTLASPLAVSPATISSPRAAACAPSRADLPQPSSTPIHPPGPKSAPSTPKQTASSPSLMRWVTLNATPSSSASQGTPRSRRVLSPLAQSRALTTPVSERRAKRRLETSETAGRTCPEECDCVRELDPVAKRRRDMAGLCCTAKAEKEEEEERSLPGSPVHKESTEKILEDHQHFNGHRPSDKENNSPGRSNWLSAMGYRLKGGQGSPSNRRSPASKGLNGKTAVSPLPCTPGSMKKISCYFQKISPE